MKMRNLILPVAVAVLLLLVVLNPAPSVAGLTQLPDEGVQLVMFAITALLTAALLFVGNLFNTDLKGWIQPLAAVIAPIIIAIIEQYLQLIPSVFDNIIITIIHLVWLLVGSVGVFFTFMRLKNKNVRALLT